MQQLYAFQIIVCTHDILLDPGSLSPAEIQYGSFRIPLIDVTRGTPGGWEPVGRIASWEDVCVCGGGGGGLLLRADGLGALYGYLPETG